MTVPTTFKWTFEARTLWEAWRFKASAGDWPRPPSVADLLAYEELTEELAKRAKGK
jgi:hypothetical protein